MGQYRTAQGKVLDMSAFTAQHEKVRAVGNMKVNARGDTIDSEGRVVQSVSDKTNDIYSATVANPGATSTVGGRFNPPSRVIESKQPQPSQLQPTQLQSAPQVDTLPAPIVEEELSEEERDLQESLEESLEEEVALEKSKTTTSKK